MPNAKTIRRERITCDEEERIRRGYRTTTHFRFAKDTGGRDRKVDAAIGKDPSQPVVRAVFAPSATLFRINHGWKGRTDDGYLIDLMNGEINPERDTNNTNQQLVRLFVNDTNNVLILYPPEEIQQDERAISTLQYALQRGVEQIFQIEESELASERIGQGTSRGIMFWEAAEGGVGVLRRLVEEEDLVSKVATAALERLHFDPTSGQDKSEKCSHACYECVLSYSNQPDHRNLDRHLVLAVLQELAASSTSHRHDGRDYDAQYTFLKNLTDSRSKLEQNFLDHLYSTRRELPDGAQKAIVEVQTIPDFYYSYSHACIYCDGSVHDDPAQKQKDTHLRTALREFGYRPIVIRFDEDLEEQIGKYPEVFGKGKK
jgi:very-short-patch-repair endonuclease